MIWGAIAYNTRSLLVSILGTMTAQRYAHDILRPRVSLTHALTPIRHFSTRKCSASHGKGFTRLSPQCYYLSWPTLSPDLSPIEHTCDHLGRRVGLPRV
ncbi:hypothetical protein TNCV_3589671 [Trichonephila clavipes]|nr:hypothetical protein TNCV_3589671 [Trichonephila clavipes]